MIKKNNKPSSLRIIHNNSFTVSNFIGSLSTPSISLIQESFTEPPNPVEGEEVLDRPIVTPQRAEEGHVLDSHPSMVA